MSEEEVRQKVAALQQLQLQAEVLQRRVVELELLLSEYNRTLETLEYFNSIEGDVEALMNLGGGVFAYVDIRENKKFLVDVGAGVVVEREVSEAIDFIKKKISRVEEAINQTSAALQEILQRAAKIQEELAKSEK
ncbi:MAG: prefoldin subunit alpha [Archaeoglobaceae archaeon]